MSDRNVEDLLKQVKAETARIGDEVKRTAEDALKQSKNAGDVSAETKAKADELIVKQNLLDDTQRKLLAKIEALETRNLDVEQKMAGIRTGTGGVDRPKSMGQQVTDSDEFKQFVSNGMRGSASIGVKMTITSVPGSSPDSASALVAPHRETEIVALPRRTMTIRQLLTQGRTSSNLVQYPRQVSRGSQAAPVADTAAKPESNYVWDLADAPVRTIAHWVGVSRQAFDDAAQLQTEIDGELRYGLDLVEEAQILKGSGSGQNLSGLVTEAAAYTGGDAGGQRIDVIRLAILQASLAEFPATGIVLHPTDWAGIELMKDGENRYLWASPRGFNAPGLWGLPIVETQSLDSGSFLVGAFLTAATIYDRMDAEVVLSSEHSDFFVKNMYAIRAEKRLALAVKRPAALCYGAFGSTTG